MQFIRNDAVEEAFTMMINKLIYEHRKIHRPLLDCLRREEDDERVFGAGFFQQGKE